MCELTMLNTDICQYIQYFMELHPDTRMCLRASFTAAMLAGALLIYGAPAAATGAPPYPLQIVAASDYAELEAEVSGKSLKHRG